MRNKVLILTACAALPLAACNSGGGSSGVASAGTNTVSKTPAGSGTTSSGGSAGTGGIPALVNVNLQNVLNDLSVRLQIDRANIPVNAQVPIDVAANVCGVSINSQIRAPTSLSPT